MSLKSHRSLLKSGQISDKLEILLEILKSCSLLYLVVTLSSESVEYHLIYTLLWLKRSYRYNFCYIKSSSRSKEGRDDQQNVAVTFE